MENIRTNMRVYRENAQMSQQELAEKLGITQANVSYVERAAQGYANPALLERIKEVLNFPGPASELRSPYQVVLEVAPPRYAVGQLAVAS